MQFQFFIRGARTHPPRHIDSGQVNPLSPTHIPQLQKRLFTLRTRCNLKTFSSNVPSLALIEGRERGADPPPPDHDDAKMAGSRAGGGVIRSTDDTDKELSRPPLHGLQQKILKIEAEIGSGRDCFHFYLVDGAVGIEEKCDEGVSA